MIWRSGGVLLGTTSTLWYEIIIIIFLVYDRLNLFWDIGKLVSLCYVIKVYLL